MTKSIKELRNCDAGQIIIDVSTVDENITQWPLN